MGFFGRNSGSSGRAGAVRPTRDGRYQAYDNRGRKIGEPQTTADKAAVAGAHAWNTPPGRKSRKS